MIFITMIIVNRTKDGSACTHSTGLRGARSMQILLWGPQLLSGAAQQGPQGHWVAGAKITAYTFTQGYI